MICPDNNLVDFVTSYREASHTSEVAEKKMSIQLLKLLLLNEAWKPLSISVVCIKWYIDLILNIFIIFLITFIYLNYKIQNNYSKFKYFLQGRL